MKKIISVILVFIMVMSVATVSFARKDKPSKPGYSGSTSNTDKYTQYFISRWGVQWDSQGDVQTRDTKYFTPAVGKGALESSMSYDFTIVIGNDVTEDDLLSYLNDVPADDEIFEKLYEEYSDAYIYTSKGKLVEWDDFVTENYGIEWYVIKRELDGWHVDGRIIENETKEDVNIVLPEEKDEFIETVLPDVPDVEQPGEEITPVEPDTPEAETPEAETPEAEEPEVVEPEEVEDTSISLKGATYAYIFGYEPIITERFDEDGNRYTTAEICMGMDDAVTVEQVSSMLVRMLDQNGNTINIDYPAVGPVAPHKGQWYERGLAYLYSMGAFSDDETISIAPIKRGHVAKLVSYALNLNLSCETPFEDVADSPYKEYIEKVYKYGYMNGESDTVFNPEGIMTRAEFCSLFNNIIGRNDCGLTAIDEDGNPFEVTAETYYFVDMDPNHWAYEICLKASSAYDEEGRYVQISTRNANIRNIIDKFDAQKEY